jgi:hypothetical protein
VIGAHVSGFAAHVVAQLLEHNLPRLLPPMTSAQRAELEAFQRDVRQSAELWLSRTSAAGGTAEVPRALLGAPSGFSMTVKEAARVLGVGVRRMRTIALDLEARGSAMKVGQSWWLDGAAVRVLAGSRQERSA